MTPSAAFEHRGDAVGALERRQGEPVLVGVGDENVFGPDGELESLELRDPLVVGHDQLAVGGGDVGSQRGAAPGRVDPDHGGADQRRRAQPGVVLGHVGQQHPDVERPLAPQRPGEGASGRGGVDHLGPRSASPLPRAARAGGRRHGP